jgi:hypothetical protein
LGSRNVPDAYGEKTVVEMASDEVRRGGNGTKRMVKALRMVAEEERRGRAIAVGKVDVWVART